MAINGETAAAQHGLYASASLDGRTDEIVVKVVNAEAVAKPVRLAIEGAAPRGDARMVILASADLQAENSLDQPTRVAPVESRVHAGRRRPAPGTPAAVGHGGAAAEGKVGRRRCRTRHVIDVASRS